jgi:hypothetical protein
VLKAHLKEGICNSCEGQQCSEHPALFAHVLAPRIIADIDCNYMIRSIIRNYTKQCDVRWSRALLAICSRMIIAWLILRPLRWWWCSSETSADFQRTAGLHNLQFTVAHTLGFSVFISRLLATDRNTEIITSNHYEVFLLFRLHSLCTPLS